jgi:glutamate racemase
MIGIFDSGVGGLTVASAIRKRCPDADFVYFGDLANAPFGPKSSDELFGITLRAMQFLREQGADEIVAACNSVSVSVIRPLMDAFGIDATNVIEMVGPAARALAYQHPKKILVIATEATVKSGMYEQTFQRHALAPIMMALPDLASAIEQGKSRVEMEQLIAPAIDRVVLESFDTLVFGCTHYPFVRDLFETAFHSRGVQVHLFDPADAVAMDVASTFDVRGHGAQIFFVSKQSDVFEKRVQAFFGSAQLTKIV